MCQGLDCDCDNGCCDGYTDFCCALTGENLCPPGTIVAGWWKADGSGFCDIGEPRPRFYLDCNQPCDSGCGCSGSGICDASCTTADCRCLSDCHSRAVDCTEFRYGQCNQHVECVGAIACRIVTCVPPWEWDPSCTTDFATDNATAFHDRPCLHDGFTDVAPNAFYTDAVAWMIANNITTGFSRDLFGPREAATRAHIATFLWRYAGRLTPSTTTGFDDVEPGAPEEQAVYWMAEHKYTLGTSATTFSPDRDVTRAEAITFLWRFAGEPMVANRHTFVDVAPSDFFDRAVSWASLVGITNGVSANEFGGAQTVDRAQIATFLFRYDQLSSMVGG